MEGPVADAVNGKGRWNGGTIKRLSNKQYTHKLPRVASCSWQFWQVCL